MRVNIINVFVLWKSAKPKNHAFARTYYIAVSIILIQSRAYIYAQRVSRVRYKLTIAYKGKYISETYSPVHFA